MVKWPQMGTSGSITYDLLRQTILNLGATTAAPYGTGTSVAKAITTGNCSNGVCSATDNGVLSSYTVTSPSTYAPALTFWPGSVILTGPTDSGTTNGGEPRLYTDIVGPSTNILLGGFVNSYGGNSPTVFAQQCSNLSTWSSIWISCPAGDSIANNFRSIGALLLQSGVAGSDGGQGGLKGRLNFLSPSSTLPATHLITLGDSNPAKTVATPGHRPTNDATDTWIGLDNVNVHVSGFQLDFGAPVSISNYISNIMDKSNWLERLTSTPSLMKSFKVPITTNSQIISTLLTNSGLAPFIVASTVPVPNLVSQSAQGLALTGTTGNIGGSLLSAGQCASGTATVMNATTSMTAVTSPSSNPLASSSQGLAIWAFVSAANTVTVEVCAIVQTSPTQTTYNVRVSQ
jgi:hypothetical protein